MSDDFSEKVSVYFQDFLEWSESNGLPFKTAASALEEKGIPALPVFLVSFLLVFGGIAFLLVSPTLSIFPPAEANVTVQLINAEDELPLTVSGIQVRLHSENESAMGTSNSKGKIVFQKKVPLGDYSLEVLDEVYSGKALSVAVDEESTELDLKVYQSKKTVTLTLDVPITVGNASFVLFDSQNKTVGNSTGSKAVFEVEKNKTYSLSVSSPGFNQNHTTIAIGSSGKTQVIVLTPREPLHKEFNLRVQVSEKGRTGVFVANASVIIRDAVTGRVVLNPVLTSSDGMTSAKVVEGNNLTVSASADGFEPASTPYIASALNDSLRLALEKIDPSGLKKLLVTIVDVRGNSVPGVQVQLFQSNVKTGYPPIITKSDGKAEFRVREGEYLVTAYKVGFLPSYMEEVPSGGDVQLKLENSLGNAGSVKVEVEDELSQAVSGASVALYRSNGLPLGIPEKITGIDGASIFSDIPFEEIFAKASANGRAAESSRVLVSPVGEEGLNHTPLQITLLPEKGSLKVTARDHFSRKTITGATVEVTTKELASCTTGADGSCTVNVLEGFGSVRVTASGYNEFSSENVQVIPNMRANFEAELVSTKVSTGIKANFAGLFDEDGRKASENLNPSAKYSAKLLLTSPQGVNYSKAVLHFRVGTAQSVVEEEPLFITGYEAQGARSIASGASYDAFSEDFSNFTQGISQQVFAQNELKWVTFEFTPFSGTKEIIVDLKTRQVTNGTGLIGFRTAFTTASEVLRDPADADAGVTKDESLAAVNSQAFEVSFGGTCIENMCLESFVESQSGTFSQNFQAQVPETFELHVKTLSSEFSALTLTLSSTSDSVKIIDAKSGPTQGVLVNTVEGQELSVSTKPGKEEAVFQIQAIRPSNQVELFLQAADKGNVLMEQTLLGTIVTSRNASLDVQASPTTLTALVENSVRFTVKDEFGNPIKDARVSVGSSEDALGNTLDVLGTGEENLGKDGKYVVTGIAPLQVGAVSYEVEARGFSLFKGTLRVDAKEIVSVEPLQDVLLDVSDGQLGTAQITVQNLLENDVAVTATLLTETENLTSFSLDQDEFDLESTSSNQFTLTAALSENILKISDKERTLTETANGTLAINAKAGRSTQEFKVPFSATTTFVQTDLDDLWFFPEDGDLNIGFEIDLDKKEVQNSSLELTSFSPYPLVVNHEEATDADWLSVTPLSTIIPAMEEGVTDPQTASLLFSAKVPKKFQNENCLFEGEDSFNTTVRVFASYQGIISEKNLTSTLKLYSSSNCVPDRGIELSIPVDLSFDLPVDAKKKRNLDDSFVAEISNNDRFLFSSDSQIDDTAKPVHVDIPQNASFTIEQKYASITSPEKFEFWLPFETTYQLGPQQQKINNKDGTTTIVFQSQDKITFPSGTTFPSNPEMQGGLLAKVPANAHVKVDKATLETSTCATSIAFPASASATLPSGTTTETTEETGDTRARTNDCSQVEFTSSDGVFLRLPPSNTYDFPSSAKVQPTTEGTFIAQIPSGSSFKFYGCSAVEGSINEYVLKLPIQSTILVPKTATVDSETISFGACEQIIQINQDGSKTTFPSARTIIAPDSQALPQDENGNTPVIISANSEITLQACPCVPGSSDAVSISYAYKYLQLENDTMQFNLSDSTKEETKEACLYNKGTDTIKVKATANVDTLGQTNLGAVGFISDSDLKFTKDFEQSNNMPPTEEGTPCLPYSITAKVPPSLLDEFGCIKKDENNDYIGTIRFTGETTKGISISGAYAPEITATINVKANNKCWYRARKDVDQSLQEFYINYDSRHTNPRTNQPMILGFKNQGHENFITLINNREEPVEVSYKAQQGFVQCFKDTESEVDFGTQTMQPAEAKIIRCVAKKQGKPEGITASLTFTITGEETSSQSKPLKITVKTMIFEVQGKEAKNLYYSTPIGELAPPLAQETAPQQIPRQYANTPASNEPPLNNPYGVNTQTPQTPAITNQQTPSQEQPQTQGQSLYTQKIQPQQKNVISFAETPIDVTATEATTTDTSTTEEPAEPTACKGNDECAIGQTCLDGTCQATVSEEDKNALGQSPYPNAKPADAVPAEELQTTQGELTGVSAATTDSYFTTCQTNYCNYEQSKKAYISFLSNMNGFIKYISANEEEFPTKLAQFCQRTRAIFGGEGAYAKTMILQLANTNQDLDYLELEAKNTLEFDPDTYVKLEYDSPESTRELKGCGTYQIKVSLDICKTGATTIEDWKQNAAVEIRTDKIHSCKPTLANAPLFIGTNSEDLGITIGRRIVHWPDEFVDGFSDFVQRYGTSTIAALSGIWSLGPYGYSHNIRDQESAKELYLYLYQNDQSTERGATIAQDYGEYKFCSDHGSKQLVTVSGASIGATAAIAGVGLLMGPVGLSWSALVGTTTARMAAGAPIALGTCFGSTIGRTVEGTVYSAGGAQEITESAGGCAAINDCIKSMVFLGGTAISATDKIVKEGYEEAKKQFAKDKWAGIGAYVVGSAALTGITSSSPEREGANVPLVVGAGAAITGVVDYVQAKKGLSATASTPQTGEQLRLFDDIDDSKVKTNLQNTVKEADKLKQELSTLSSAQQSLVKKAAALNPDDEAALKVIKDRLRLTHGFEVTKIDDLISAQKQLGSAEETIKQGGKISKIYGALKNNKAAIARFTVQAASLLAFNVNVRPVQAVLDESLSSHIVAYHLERKLLGQYFPSAYRLCVKNKKMLANDDCVDDKSFLLPNLCNSDKNACLYSMPLETTSETSPQGFNLVYVKNDETADSNALFDSVFNPAASPLSGKLGTFDGGEIKKNDVNRLKNQNQDTGTGKGAITTVDETTQKKGEVNILDASTTQAPAESTPAKGTVPIAGPAPVK